MAADEIRWVVRLTPPKGRTIRDLLEIPLSLDVCGIARMMRSWRPHRR